MTSVGYGVSHVAERHRSESHKNLSFVPKIAVASSATLGYSTIVERVRILFEVVVPQEKARMVKAIDDGARTIIGVHPNKEIVRYPPNVVVVHRRNRELWVWTVRRAVVVVPSHAGPP